MRSGAPTVVTRVVQAAARDLCGVAFDGMSYVARGDRATGRDTTSVLTHRSKAPGASQELEGGADAATPSDRSGTDEGRVVKPVVRATPPAVTLAATRRGNATYALGWLRPSDAATRGNGSWNLLGWRHLGGDCDVDGMVWRDHVACV